MLTDSGTKTAVATVLAVILSLMIWPAVKMTTGIAALPLTLLLGLATVWLIHRHLPSDLTADLTALAKKRSWLTVIWCLLVIAGIAQTARQSLHHADPDRQWWLTTKDAFWAEHACMSAYVYAADLNRQGDANVYQAEHYPGLNPNAEVNPTVKNLNPDDPYVYPPQFLMLPRLAIGLSNDFRVIKAVWYSLQALLMVGVTLWVARWFGGSTGTLALVLTPLLWFSVPSLYNLHYGQIHVTSFLLAMAAFVTFERKQELPGGLLLALAILCKGYGSFVLIPLLLWRRWRALFWTGIWGVGLTVLALVVLGIEPFEAFFTYNLPRLKTGAAFAFDEAWPDFRAVLLAGNLSVFSGVRKLGELGLGGMTDDVAQAVHSMFTMAVVGASFLAGRVKDKRLRAGIWLALLNLASLTSPGAWGDYISFGSFWVLLLMMANRPWRTRALLIVVAFFFAFVPGGVPYGESMNTGFAMVLSLAITVMLLGANGWIIFRALNTVPTESDSL